MTARDLCERCTAPATRRITFEDRAWQTCGTHFGYVLDDVCATMRAGEVLHTWYLEGDGVTWEPSRTWRVGL